MTWTRKNDGDLTWFESDLLAGFPELRHAVSTRSSGTLTEADNRRIFCEEVGANPNRLTFCRQVLGADVVEVDRPFEDERPEADAMVTRTGDLPLLTFSADCLLLMLYDPDLGAIANVHSSRFGAIEEISGRAMEAMPGRPEDLYAALGPSIGPCCYNLRDEVRAEWESRHDDTDLYLKDGHLDLPRVTRIHLERAGVRPERIDEANVCTQCEADLFYSYRREGDNAGRFGALIWLT